MLELNLDNKVGIAERKMSVREPTKKKPENKRRFSAFTVKEDLVSLPLSS